MVRSSNPKIPRVPAKLVRKLLKSAKVKQQEYTKLGLDALAKQAEQESKQLKKILIKKSKQQPGGR